MFSNFSASTLFTLLSFPIVSFIKQLCDVYIKRFTTVISLHKIYNYTRTPLLFPSRTLLLIQCHANSVWEKITRLFLAFVCWVITLWRIKSRKFYKNLYYALWAFPEIVRSPPVEDSGISRGVLNFRIRKFQGGPVIDSGISRG